MGVLQVLSGINEVLDTGTLLFLQLVFRERSINTRYFLQNKILHFDLAFGNCVVLHPKLTSHGQNSE